MPEVVIVEAVRTAVGKKNGTLSNTHPIDLLGPVQAEVLRRAGVDSSQVGQVVGGCIDQVGAQSANITRTAWLGAGLDENVASTTVDSQCGSSQQALALAVNLVGSGAEDIAMACGVENMSMVPLGANAMDGAKAGHGKPINRTYATHYEYTSQFEGAERIADKYGITRADTDAFGLESQIRARRAVDEGRFEGQILPIEATQVDADGKRLDETITFGVDEVLRDTSLEALANLKPVARPDGVHTAGSSSQISDGAAAVLVTTADKAKELGLTPKARVLQTCLVGCDPVLMLEGPIPATQRLLDRQGLTIDDIDVFEINEAFASVVLAWARTLKPDMGKVNPNGGAIALGHPLGGTGCILLTKTLHELERSDGEYGLATMCCGGGLGTGTLIQRI
ncbi:MAG TPA: steroid 3-ketoacyl-CoA thiolase [Acidimicrobiales bacterium]|jgi:acetyl-CoA C-acetyltransferase|nr:steroid 3-ketoacyl-CoA thiolase [Acidimicrobiales bacterium]